MKKGSKDRMELIDKTVSRQYYSGRVKQVLEKLGNLEETTAASKRADHMGAHSKMKNQSASA